MYRPSGFAGIPPVIKNLLILNVIFYLATYFVLRQYPLVEWLSLYYPSSVYFHPYQFVTYMFMHGGFWHIAFNMLALWMFGSNVESFWGPKKFLTFYLACGLGAAALQTAITAFTLSSASPEYIQGYLNSPGAAMLGASGAVYGVLLAFGFLFPNMEVFMMFIPIPIKAKYAVMIWAGLELASGIGMQDNVAHFAHLGGMLTGLILILIWRSQGKLYN
ncbi:MAG: rhomboid family intramembrane serine protease [Bacteroidetes bacterium]|nr:rhomboid family intramembrane serine protease [Bacteroidota bacterium]